MDRDDCPGSCGDRWNDGFSRKVLALGIDIDANRVRTSHHYATGRRDKRARSCNNFVSGTYPKRLQG
jgi:hypothetical protein